MLTSKQRAKLRGMANTIPALYQVGKDGITENIVEQFKNALEARELIKLSILKNCLDDGREIAAILAERTHSEVVQVIGKKIVLYKQAKDEKKRKIELPK